MSCTTRQAVKIEPPRELLIDSMMERIKRNSPDIKKYFILDENREIIVKADLTGTWPDTNEIEHFEVIYDLKYPEAGSGGAFLIPFSVRSSETGETRYDRLTWKPRKDVTGVLLSFDDDFMENWEENFDLFDQYNARVTFFIQGDYNSFCITALERGHDIGYHTQNHLNLTKVSREVFDEETSFYIDDFRNEGVPLTSFAYPFGLSEPWMHDELLESFKILRGYGVTYRLYERTSIREGFSSSKALDNILFKKDEDFEAAIDIMFRTVMFIGGDLILPLTTHIISDDADWGIKPHRLRYLLESAKDLQLNFYRYKDL